MKFIIVFAALVAFAAAGALPPTSVLEHTEVRDEAGQYSVRYLTENGIALAERGILVPNADRTENTLRIEVTSPWMKCIIRSTLICLSSFIYFFIPFTRVSTHGTVQMARPTTLATWLMRTVPALKATICQKPQRCQRCQSSQTFQLFQLCNSHNSNYTTEQMTDLSISINSNCNCRLYLCNKRMI